MKVIGFVSIIIPCRNEAKFISKCLDSIIDNDFPKGSLEVLVVDGMSNDGTREIIEDYYRKYSFIRMLDNPSKIIPCALNTGIHKTKGDFIIRMDAHAIYERDYISKCIRYINEYDADNVGGIMITLPRDNTYIGKAIANVLSNRFGVGNSVFRTGAEEPKLVDTVFGGCYRREVFDKIGLFNEELVCSQDMEFNKRLKRAGGKILLVPEIVSYYHARSDFKSFVNHNFRNGVWIILPLLYSNKMPVCWRHFMPMIFVFSLSSLALLSFFIQIFMYLFLFICGLYLLINLYVSSQVAIKEKKIRYLLIMPVIFTSLHVIYGLGSIWGLLKVIASKRFWNKRFKVNEINLKGVNIER